MHKLLLAATLLTFQSACLVDAIDGAGAASDDDSRFAESRGFHVSAGSLYDANGNRFVIRGVNNAHIWFDSRGRDLAYDALDAIAAHGANTVRIVWDTSGSAADLDRVIARVIDLEMIPIVELHDATGSPDRAALIETARYYTRPEIEAVLQRHEKHLLVNIANEWSGDDFLGGYREAIALLRGAGIRHTLVIDANGWGQNVDSVLTHGPTLLADDPEANLLFSVHMYELFADPARVRSVLQTARDRQIPLVVGEFGFQHGQPQPTPIPFDVIMAESERLGHGTIAWSWKGNSGGVEYLDMAIDWAGTQLTGWGDEVINGPNGIRQTSRRASIFDAPSALPLCDANDGRGWGSIFECDDRLCAKTDTTYQQTCAIRGTPTAPNGLPYCLSNGGAGHGSTYQCGAETCAKTDTTYQHECVIL